MNLFEECMELLDKDAKIIDQSVAKNILIDFDKNFPLNFYGRIDWDKVKVKKTIFDFKEIITYLVAEKKDPSCLIYIIGSDPKIPIFESTLTKVLNFFYDVEAISPNSWFFCPSDGWVVEVFHNGEITIGCI